MCCNKDHSYEDFLRQKPTVKELVEYIDFENSLLSFGLILGVRKEDLTEDIKARIPDKTIALLELWLNTPDLSRRQLLEELRKDPNTHDVAEYYEKNLMKIYEGTTCQCATESSKTRGVSEYVGGKIEATPTGNIDEPCTAAESAKVNKGMDSRIDNLETMAFSLLEALQELKKAKKEESREIQEMEQRLAAERDRELEQNSKCVAELQVQKKMNKALMRENEILTSEIKKKERIPEQIESDSNVQYITESSSSNDEIFLECLTFKTLKSLVPSLLTNESVKRLNIQSTSLNEFAHHFSVLMTNNSTLKHLLLTHNTIDDEGVKMLAHSLKANVTLTYLSLDFNYYITSASCQSLAVLLRANRILRVLSLSHTNIDFFGAHTLVKSLESNDTLKWLVLDERHRVPFSGVSKLRFFTT